MIQTARWLGAAVIATLREGSRAIGASWRGVPDAPGGPYDRAAFQWSSALLRAGRITVRVEGPGVLRDRPVVYVANHISLLDIPALVVGLPPVPKFVMKKELLRVPIFGRAAKAAGHIAIDRANRGAAFAAYDEAAEVVRQGRSALVFAEGTRSRHGKLLPFKKGPFVLAIAAHVPIVPVVVVGSYDLMPSLAMVPKPGEIVLRIGEDIPTVGCSYDDRVQLSDRARGAMLGLGAVAF
ncbi:MAG TPA: lysophospholipid acyltransferase family protein [Gemmatimonadales bacterium]|nr:lysophospholipid acyltransferase family protein [Gemmatimonadales bacterium]